MIVCVLLAIAKTHLKFTVLSQCQDKDLSKKNTLVETYFIHMGENLIKPWKHTLIVCTVL
jgi:hypothetical protein